LCIHRPALADLAIVLTPDPGFHHTQLAIKRRDKLSAAPQNRIFLH
jgi:hypothetical protein